MERTVANKSSSWSPTNAGKTNENHIAPLRLPVKPNLPSKSSPAKQESIIDSQTTEWLTEGIRRSLSNNAPPPPPLNNNRGIGLINATSGRSPQRQEIAKGESQTKQSLLGIVRSPVPSAVQPKERFFQKSLQLKSPPNPTTPNPITKDNQEQSDSTTKNNQEQSNPLPSAVVQTPATNQPPQTLTPKTNNQPQLGQKNTQKAQLPQNIPGEKGASLQTPNQGKEQAPPMAANGKTSTILENVKIDQKGKAPASAQEDSQFQAVIGNVKGVALEQKHHQRASEKSQEAQAAAQSPPKEIESQAQEKQVGKIEQAETPPFDSVAFKAALMKRIAETTPKNLEEADNFKNNNKIDSVKGELDGKVKEEKTASQKPIEEKTKETPDTTGIKPKDVTPLPPNQPGAAPSDVGANQAVPKSKGKGEIEAPMKAESQNIDKQMADAKVTDEQLSKSNEPEFQEALKGKKEAQTNAKQAPQQYRQFEQVNLEKAQSEAVKTAQDKTQGMHSDRTQQLTQVGGKQVETKGKDEQERTKIAGDIDKIYQGTKTNVETILSELDGEVNKTFDDGAAQAKQAFEEYVDKKMKAYKDDRYSGFWGPGKWLVDKLLGMPSEVNAFYQEGRNFYLQKMDGVINQVVTLVGQKLTAAKTEVSNGKKQVQNYVNQLPQNLKSVGQEAAKEIQGKFEQLEENINSKQEELIDNLAQKYNEKLQEVDAKIDEMKAENRGLIAKAIDFVVGVIKTIIELGKLLLEVLARVASVVPQILKNPIGFFGNLISGIKQGFLSFMGNIAKYLQQGLIGWLTGAVAGTGIEMPESFDLKGVFSLAAQLLGLGYQMIRSRAVNRLGEEKVGWLEKTFDVFRLLATKGISALWELVKDKIGDLKSMVMDAIENFVIEKVIQEGIQYVLSLLNPASAFVKACQAIYRIVKFFIDRAAQIGELINAILDSIVAIAAGNVGQMVKAIENALAKTIPVVISFMASLLGLGDISQKIQGILKKVRQPIEKVIDWLISQAVKFAKKVGKFGKKVGGKIGKKLGFGKEKIKNNKHKNTKNQEHDLKVSEGLAAIDKAEKSYLKEGKISEENAMKVANKVKANHKVFKSLTVVDGGNTWDYEYIASPLGKRKGEKKDENINKKQKLLSPIDPSQSDRYKPDNPTVKNLIADAREIHKQLGLSSAATVGTGKLSNGKYIVATNGAGTISDKQLKKLANATLNYNYLYLENRDVPQTKKTLSFKAGDEKTLELTGVGQVTFSINNDTLSATLDDGNTQISESSQLESYTHRGKTTQSYKIDFNKEISGKTVRVANLTVKQVKNKYNATLTSSPHAETNMRRYATNRGATLTHSGSDKPTCFLCAVAHTENQTTFGDITKESPNWTPIE